MPPWRPKCRPSLCPLRPRCARSPPRWCGRLPAWAAMSRPSCPGRLPRDCKRNSPGAEKSHPGDDMTRVLAVLFAIMCAAPVLAETLPPGLDPQNTLYLDTKYGRVIIKLNTEVAPLHAERLKLLAREHFYDNVPFHRVIDGFMAQTGDGKYGNGTGGSKYPDLKAEFSKVPFKRGTVGMARASSPNSANSQFFIMFADGSFLNGQYTVVGEVVRGMDAVDKLKKGEPPADPDRIIHMQVAADA